MHCTAARAFAENGHALRIATESRDVVPYPLERRDLVEKAEVAAEALIGERRVGEEAKTGEAIVEADEDHAIAREVLARINGNRAKLRLRATPQRGNRILTDAQDCPGQPPAVVRETLEAVWKELVLKAGWAPAAVLATHAAYSNLIGHPPVLDLVMHPVGGVAVGYAIDQALKTLSPWLGRLTVSGHSLLVVGASWMIANLWEYAEFLSDQLLGTRIQKSVAETMVDLILGTGAATLFVVVVHIRRVGATSRPGRPK